MASLSDRTVEHVHESRPRSEMIGQGAAVVVGPEADEPRQLVGPYAWVVLEHLAQRTDPTKADTAVSTSTRSIAAQLAISKDTVTRALRRLLDAGLIDRVVERDAGTGQFGNATYQVHLERAGLRVDVEERQPFERDGGAPELAQITATHRPTSSTAVTSSTPARSPRRRRTAGRDQGAQLSLLDPIDTSEP